MTMQELVENYKSGKIEKKLYWTLVRDNYTCLLPELQALVRNNPECKRIIIDDGGCILEKNSGLKLYFNFNEPFSRAEIDLFVNDPETAEIEWVKRYLAENDCKVIFDIGANVGLYSMELYTENAGAEYYVFEPIPSTYERLLKTVDLNQICKNNFHTF